jgi:hypothetical protein
VTGVLTQLLLAGLLPSVKGQVPSAPTGLQVEQATNPTAVDDNTPDFRATHAGPPGPPARPATRYRIQVSTDTTFAAVSHWDGPAGGVAFGGSGVPVGSQCPEIAYGAGGGTVNPLHWNTTYSWRIKFWNNQGEGPFSFPALFGMAAPSAVASANGNGSPGSDSWRLIGVPIAPGTTVPATELLDDVSLLYRWNEPTRTYTEVGSGDVLEGGVGYYAYTAPGAPLDLLQGTVASGTQTLSFSWTNLPAPTGQEIVEGKPRNAFQGNHFVVNPFNAPISWNGVALGGHVTRTSISPSYHKWDGSQYLVYNGFSGSGDAGPTIVPFQAIGIVALSGSNSLEINEPAPVSGGPLLAAAAGAASPDANSWELVLEARSAGALDTQNIAGVHPESQDTWDERDSEEPGAGSATWVLVSFDHWSWAVSPRDYTHDVRKTPVNAGDEVVWDVTVRGNTGQPVTLTWPGLASLPTADWTFTLEDPGTGASVDLTASSSYDTGPVSAPYPLVLRARRLTDLVGTLEVRGAGGAPPSPVLAGTTGVGMLDVEFRALAEPVTVNSVQVDHQGTGGPARVSVSLWRAGARIAGPASFSGTSATFAGLSETVAPDAPQVWSVVYDFSAAASGTYRAAVPAGQVRGTGVYSGRAVVPAAATIVGQETSVVAPARGGGGSCGLLGWDGVLAVFLTIRWVRRTRR